MEVRSVEIAHAEKESFIIATTHLPKAAASKKSLELCSELALFKAFTSQLSRTGLEK